MKRSKSGAAGSPHLSRLSLPAVHPTEPFVGAAIVGELPPARALLFCEAYRCVASWAAAKPGERAGLFSAGAAERVRGVLERTPGLTPEVRGALETVCDLLADPGAMTEERAADACLRIAEWAEAHQAPESAFRFVQAAATCAGMDARVAYRAGCMARQRGIWPVAELWFRHAVAAGRRARDWEGHARGYLGLGHSYLRQGRYPAARREHAKTLRVSRRHGFREIQGKALHDLFVVAVESRDPGKAQEHARGAFRAYGADHPAIPALAHDVAYFWMSQGHHRRAAPVFRALLPHFHGSENHLRTAASLARAAAGAGDRATFERAWADAWTLMPGYEGTAACTTSLLELAHAAAISAEWDRAEEAATRARRQSAHRCEADVVENADRLLDSVLRKRVLPAAPGSCEALGTGEDADALVAELVRALEESASAR